MIPRESRRFRPVWNDVSEAVEDAHIRWDALASEPAPVSRERLVQIQAQIRAVAVELSGTTHDAAARAILYFALYEDSERNFPFPLVAAHGSLWGVHHTERIDRFVTPLIRASRTGRIQRWLDGLDAVRDVNRRVFREIYANFYFTRFFGRHPLAPTLLKPEVVDLYNRVHEAIRTGSPLDHAERRDVYFGIFVYEQEDIVDPGLKDAAAAAGPLLVRLLKRVSPRFAYFPRRERLWFTDFTRVDQRNREGLRAFEFAEEVGPERVFEAMGEYA